MEKDVLDLIGKMQYVYLATVDGTQARVRPFGFMGLRDGKLWFCTARDKEVFAQLSQNPQVEFAYTFAPEMVTLRIRGAVSLDDDMDVARRSALAIDFLVALAGHELGVPGERF